MVYTLQIENDMLKMNTSNEREVTDMTMITNEMMETIATYMNDGIREDVHAEVAPCTNEIFLKKYIEKDPEFSDLLWSEFSIEL